MAGQLDGFFNSMIVNVYYTYLLLKKLREINDLRQQLDATDRMRSLEKNRVHVLQWIQNLGPFQQVEEEEEEDEGFISIYLALLIMDIYNCSLGEGYAPDLL